MAVRDPRRRVLAYCYASLALRPTHARMTEREFERFQGELVFWCPSCATAHTARREELQQRRPAAEEVGAGRRRAQQAVAGHELGPPDFRLHGAGKVQPGDSQPGGRQHARRNADGAGAARLRVAGRVGPDADRSVGGPVERGGPGSRADQGGDEAGVERPRAAHQPSPE